MKIFPEPYYPIDGTGHAECCRDIEIFQERQAKTSVQARQEVSDQVCTQICRPALPNAQYLKKQADGVGLSVVWTSECPCGIRAMGA